MVMGMKISGDGWHGPDKIWKCFGDRVVMGTTNMGMAHSAR